MSASVSPRRSASGTRQEFPCKWCAEGLDIICGHRNGGVA